MSSSPSLAERFRAACRDTPPSNNSPPLQQHLSDALQQLHPLIHLPPVQSPLQPSPTPRQLLAQRATVQPDPQLSSLTWANSRSRQVLRDFAHECGSQRDQPSDPSSNPPHPSAPASSPIDPVLWAAQEHAAASAVLRDIRALHLRRKAAPHCYQREDSNQRPPPKWPERAWQLPPPPLS
ncbi:hypothetical protein BWQ96_06142 [Gracilariopsis chorda]|uniref:Uncharacterized protein n=1 Tax=Gracilariopsis chorda TaxID=448386 RepID=A0A2V3IPP8_9FLOR|nr:hypothetical protein BWQ96_06142 [Gracilariopsis chorda]|eukprot:PXF44061.1 hypothetical protein BWQ96_06142 [Gracilariopsis chorda]